MGTTSGVVGKVLLEGLHKSPTTSKTSERCRKQLATTYP